MATTQAGAIKDALAANGHAAELVIISTEGDRSTGPIADIGVGVFTAALREAIHERRVDMAVHSYKDLPTAPDPRFKIAAIPPREDARDALVARDGLVLGELPVGSVIGTSSPRRAAQLRALGLGLEIRPLRGNLDTRLNRVSNGDLDGIVVARAGLARIGRLADVTETLEPVQMLPAPAQGALAVECRADDTELAALLAELDDADTRAAVTAERVLLAELEAGCSAPVGAIAEVVESIDEDGRVFEELSLRGCVATLDGSDVIRASGIGTPDRARELGLSVADGAVRTGRTRSVGRCWEREMTGHSGRGRKTKPGRITFVGSGPGDPGLLTTRARTVLANAALVFTDPDVPEAVLALAGSELPPPSGPEPAEAAKPADTDADADKDCRAQSPADAPVAASAATRIPGGPDIRPALGDPAEVAKTLATEARTGVDVVRLVAGDPLSVDAVITEVNALAKTHLNFEIVPGLPDTTAVPTYAGLPLGSAHTVADVRGDVDWAALAAAPGPLILHATASHLPDAARTLIEYGLADTTPTVVTANGTTCQQRSVETTLAGLLDKTTLAGTEPAGLPAGPLAGRWW